MSEREPVNSSTLRTDEFQFRHYLSRLSIPATENTQSSAAVAASSVHLPDDRSTFSPIDKLDHPLDTAGIRVEWLQLLRHRFRVHSTRLLDVALIAPIGDVVGVEELIKAIGPALKNQTDTDCINLLFNSVEFVYNQRASVASKTKRKETASSSLVAPRIPLRDLVSGVSILVAGSMSDKLLDALSPEMATLFGYDDQAPMTSQEICGYLCDVFGQGISVVAHLASQLGAIVPDAQLRLCGDRLNTRSSRAMFVRRMAALVENVSGILGTMELHGDDSSKTINDPSSSVSSLFSFRMSCGGSPTVLARWSDRIDSLMGEYSGNGASISNAFNTLANNAGESPSPLFKAAEKAKPSNKPAPDMKQSSGESLNNNNISPAIASDSSSAIPSPVMRPSREHDDNSSSDIVNVLKHRIDALEQRYVTAVDQLQLQMKQLQADLVAERSARQALERRLNSQFCSLKEVAALDVSLEKQLFYDTMVREIRLHRRKIDVLWAVSGQQKEEEADSAATTQRSPRKVADHPKVASEESNKSKVSNSPNKVPDGVPVLRNASSALGSAVSTLVASNKAVQK